VGWTTTLIPNADFLCERRDFLPESIVFGCDVEVKDATSIVAKQDKGEKYAKRGRWDGEEVDGDDVDQMIVEKGAPSL